jgi:hypothetical protein
MSRRLRQSTTYLRLDQVEALDAISKRTRVPVAEYIREGVDFVIEAARQRGLLDAPVAATSAPLALPSAADLDDSIERVLRRLLPAGLLDGKH